MVRLAKCGAFADRSRRNKRQAACQLSMEEVSGRNAADAHDQLKQQQLLEVLQWFYSNAVQPTFRLVARRLEELTGKWLSPVCLRQLANKMPGAIFCPADAAHANEPRLWLCPQHVPKSFLGFLDLSRSEDTYPSTVWRKVRACFSADSPWFQELLPQPCFRYRMAQCLLHSLPAMRSYSLGQALHIVELAVRRHQILGYRNGGLVAYTDSEDCAKHACADKFLPTSMFSAGEAYVQTWERAQLLLSQLLGQPEWVEGLPASILKMCFRHRFGVELRETALGHTKLTEFLKDPRLAETCSIVVHQSERFIVAVKASAIAAPIAKASHHLDCSQGASSDKCPPGVWPQDARGNATPKFSGHQCRNAQKLVETWKFEHSATTGTTVPCLKTFCTSVFAIACSLSSKTDTQGSSQTTLESAAGSPNSEIMMETDSESGSDCGSDRFASSACVDLPADWQRVYCRRTFIDVPIPVCQQSVLNRRAHSEPPGPRCASDAGAAL